GHPDQPSVVTGEQRRHPHVNPAFNGNIKKYPCGKSESIRIFHHANRERLELRFSAMPQDTSAQFVEAERAELERVVRALTQWPRLSHLLAYMGEKLSSGHVDQLNEYNIATEVLGRSKTVFNAAEDAIARVETHRLRKRLAEFYEKEGRNHP